ncbi:MAG: hypothetical protein ACXVBF_12755 [Flavisolibacter sp.]
MTKHILIFRILLFAILFALLFFSCKALTPEKAAQGGYRKARSVM